MNGRVENDIKIFSQVEDKIIDYPQYISSWYFYLKANEHSAMGCNSYINMIICFLEFINKDINKVKLTDFNEDLIIRYFLSIKYKDDGKETSISYKQSIWSCLNNFFKYLYNRKLISENYFINSGIERPKGNDLDRINKNRKLLTKEDFRKIINAIDVGVGSNKAKGYQKTYRNRDKLILLLFMTTGMRKTALQEINVNDIDIDNHKLYVIDKGHKSHVYYLSDDIIKILDKWLIDRYFILKREDDGALFISKEKKRMSGNSISRIVDKYSYEALGYHISPHKLRSGFASILYDEKRDLEYVRRVIGHSNIATTQRYVVTDNNEREEAVGLIIKDIA